MTYSGPFTTVTVRHYEAMLHVVKAAKELLPALEGISPLDLDPDIVLALRDRLAEWERER